jgi:single stranded DNA-binding protein
MSRRGVNKVILVGNLGADPETRFTPAGVQVSTVNMATTETWTDRSGQRQERTEWHRLVLWRRLAELAGQYLKKGSKIYIEGKLKTRSWDDPKGHKHYITEIVVYDMQMLDAAGGPLELDMAYGNGTNESPANENQINENGINKDTQLAQAVSDRAVTNPAVTNRAVTNPAVTNRAVTNPAVTNRAVTNPAVTNPALTHTAYGGGMADGDDGLPF